MTVAATDRPIVLPTELVDALKAWRKVRHECELYNHHEDGLGARRDLYHASRNLARAVDEAGL